MITFIGQPTKTLPTVHTCDLRRGLPLKPTESAEYCGFALEHLSFIAIQFKGRAAVVVVVAKLL